MAQRKIRSIAIVGAGLAGSTIAYQLSGRGYDLTVIDQRPHLAGNVHTERDEQTGVMVHKYGPHIFHTDNEAVWKFVAQFAEFVPYVQRTKAISDGAVYSLPINLHTINQFYGKQFSPDEARAFLAGERIVYWGGRHEPENFQEAAENLIGVKLYRAFMYGYTVKQWGRLPLMLPASILKRLPMRFDYNDNAFFHKYQGIPVEGYTEMIRNMLDLPDLTVQLGTKFKPEDAKRFDHVFYSGPIDEWFDYRLGSLPYRTLDFTTIRVEGDFQGCSVLNNCDLNTPWTRSTEHKHFTPWETHSGTVVTREYSREAKEGDVLFYPVRLAAGQSKLLEYQALAAEEATVSFVGRLGTYQYIDMDVTVAAAIQTAKDFHRAHIGLL